MRRVRSFENINTLGEGSDAPEGQQPEHLAHFTIGDSSSDDSSVPSYLQQRPQSPLSESLEFDISTRQPSGQSGGIPPQDDGNDDFEPSVHSDYIRYSDFERKRRLLEQRETNIQESSGVRPKTFTGKIKKALDKLKRKGGFDLERIPEETKINPYESLLPQDEEGYPAVYGEYEGRAIHGPVELYQYFPDYSRIGTQYREVPGSRLQQSYPRVFGSPDKPLTESHIKFLKEKGFTVQKKLGMGGFGEVWLVRQHFTEWSEGTQTRDDRMLACKILTLRTFELKTLPLNFAVDSITKEADTYSQLNHLNIVERVQVINLFDSESGFPHPIKVLMFMELMKGDLYSLIHKENKDDVHFENRQQECGWAENPEKFTHLWSKQIVSGLRYLHENNVSHMDIKPENILYSTHMEGEHNKYIFKLTDFGLALKFETNVDNVYIGQIGTLGYRAPEVDSGAMYETKSSDIYSLGVVMAESIASDDRDINNVIQGIRHYDETAAIKFKISSWFATLVAHMLDPRPDFRPDILQVYNDYWIKMSFEDQEDVESTRL